MYSLFLAVVLSVAQAGVQIETGAVRGSLPYLRDDGWVKYRLTWGSDLAIADRELGMLAGHPLLLNIHNAPLEYQVTPWACGDIENYEAYAGFVLAMIDRYEPVAVELWNEPDMPPGAFSHLFGCWSSAQRYAEMTAYVCTAVKRVRPDVTLLAGALAAESFADHIHPTACDGLSFHYYPSASARGSDWAGLPERIERFVRLGHTNLWLTETSLLDDPDGELQAAWFCYVKQLRIPFFWYTLSGNGWRNSDMVSLGVPKSVWYTYTGAETHRCTP